MTARRLLYLRAMFQFFALLSLFTLRAFADPLQLGVGLSKSLSVDKLARAAVANGKVAKARALPPSTLLLTGIHPGKTTVRAWDEKGVESVYEVDVVPADLVRTPADDGDGVVKISLEFLEIDSLVGESLGIRWPDAIHFQGAGHWEQATSGLNYTATFGSARGLIQLVLHQGWGRVLAKPDLYVRLGEEAIFHSGGELPVSTATETYGRYHRQVEWKPFGLTVRVRPRSGDHYHISSDIKVDVSELNPATAIEGIPGLTKRNFETKMSSRDGETVILSGLVRQAASVEKEGIPFLSGIPLLGSLFSSKRTTGDENEIMMAVTFSLATRGGTSEKPGKFRARFDSAEAP